MATHASSKLWVLKIPLFLRTEKSLSLLTTVDLFLQCFLAHPSCRDLGRAIPPELSTKMGMRAKSGACVLIPGSFFTTCKTAFQKLSPTVQNAQSFLYDLMGIYHKRREWLVLEMYIKTVTYIMCVFLQPFDCLSKLDFETYSIAPCGSELETQSISYPYYAFHAFNYQMLLCVLKFSFIKGQQWS